MTTIHMIGHTAKVAPSAIDASASPIGNCHKPTAITSPTISPPSDACQAGRRRTPNSTSTVTTGSVAMINDGSRAPATGVSSC